MALLTILSRAAISTRCCRVRVASAVRQSSLLRNESYSMIPRQQVKTFHCSLYNGYPGKIIPLSSKVTGMLYRPLSSQASRLEDADNVYFKGLLERIKKGDIQMIDVRDKSELDEFGTIIKDICHIPVLDVEAALQLPDGEFRAKYGQAKPKKTDDNIVFTCKKGIRSLTARDTARKLGFTQAKHYPGGWMEWGRRNGLPYPKE